MLIPKIQFTLVQITQFDKTIPRNRIYVFNHVNDFKVNEDFENLSTPGEIIMPRKTIWAKELNPDGEAVKLGSTTPKQILPDVLDPIDSTDLTQTQRRLVITHSEEKFKGAIATPDTAGDPVPRPKPSGITNPNQKRDSQAFLDMFRMKQPVFAIGDKIRMCISYINPLTNDILSTQVNQNGDIIEFDRYKKDVFIQDYVITGLDLNENLVIKIDNFSWYLKQTIMPNKTISKGTDIIKEIEKAVQVANTKFKIFPPIEIFQDPATNQSITFNDKLVISGNLSVSEFLGKLKKDYNILSFFGRLKLNIGLSVGFYSNNIYNNSVFVAPGLPTPSLIDLYSKFKFRQNIISSNLEYTNKDALELSAIVSNTFETAAGGVTKDGHTKMKKIKKSIYISIKGSEITVDQKVPLAKVITLYDELGNKVGEPPSVDDAKSDGERRTFTFPWANTLKDLRELGVQELLKHYYTGYRGSFETFGEPLTFPGYIIRMTDDELLEKTGNYRVKGVERSFGLNGYRQRITLDIKIPD